jgi:hypothetical protein
VRRVVDDQEASDDGLPRSTATLGAPGALTGGLGDDQGPENLTIVTPPFCDPKLGLSGGVLEDMGEAIDARTDVGDLPEQRRERPVILALPQRQQHGDEVLPLGLTEAVAKDAEVLTQSLLHHVDGERHRGTSRTEWGLGSLYSQACRLPPLDSQNLRK